MNLGATKYMTSHKATFDTYKILPSRNVCLGDDNMAEAIGMGCIVVSIEMRGITDVFHVPKLQANLLLVSKLL